jgi:hypothetical protein
MARSYLFFITFSIIFFPEIFFYSKKNSPFLFVIQKKVYPLHPPTRNYATAGHSCWAGGRGDTPGGGPTPLVEEGSPPPLFLIPLSFYYVDSSVNKEDVSFPSVPPYTHV